MIYRMQSLQKFSKDLHFSQHAVVTKLSWVCWIFQEEYILVIIRIMFTSSCTAMIENKTSFLRGKFTKQHEP